MRTVFAIHIAAIVALVVPAWGLTGKVVDSKGKPIYKATVLIGQEFSPSSMKTFRADDKGEITVTAKDMEWPASALDLTMSFSVLDKAGEPAAGASVTMPIDHSIKSVSLRTDRKGRFSYKPRAASIPKYEIRILDSAGKPLVGGKLRTKGRQYGPVPVMDSKGEYRYPTPEDARVGPRSGPVMAMADGYSYAVDYVGANHKRPLVLKLWPEMVVKGRVRSSDGRSISGALIVVGSVSGSFRGRSLSKNYWPMAKNHPSVARSSNTGSFTLRHLPKAGLFQHYNIQLRVYAPGHAHAILDLNKDGLKKPLSVTLSPVAAAQAQ